MAKVLHGDASTNQLVVTTDKTQVYGLKGDDTLISDNKSEVLLVGGSGDDSLIMTGGDGTLNGGKGSDVFEFTYSASQSVSAVIEDFNPEEEDKIVVNYVGDTAPKINRSISESDVVWSDGGNFNVTLKGVRENDYFDDEERKEIWDVLELTNAEREKESLPALTLSEGLMEAASIRVGEILQEYKEKTKITHTRYPSGEDYKTVFEGKYNFVGENLEGESRSAKDVMDEWMKSKDHKKNILDTRFHKLGVGYKHDDEAIITEAAITKESITVHEDYWVQEFADSLVSDYQETVDVSSATVTPVTVSKSIMGDNTANTLENNNYGVTIDALGGNDSITNKGLIVSISGGDGSDTIDNSGSNVTINAGKGDDSISLQKNAKEILIEYKAGDGSDTITGFSATSTLKILEDDEYTTATVKADILGTDVVVLVGAESITLVEGASNSTVLHIAGSKLFIGTEDADTFENADNDATIKTRGGDDTIKNYGSNVTIEAGSGNDLIYNTGNKVLFSYDNGDDTIQGFNETSTLKVASGSYSSVMTGNDLILIGSDSTKSIRILDASNLSSINVLDENNELVEVKSSEYINHDTEGAGILRINADRGAIIQTHGGNDTIQNIGDRVIIEGGAGNDSIDNSGDRVTINGSVGDDTVNNSGSNVTIDGGADKDYIENSGDGVTINGGAGDDTINNRGLNVLIIGGHDIDSGSNDLIINNQQGGTVYLYEGGNDTIEGFNDSDSLNIRNYTCNTVRSGDDIIVNIIDNADNVGSITLKEYPPGQGINTISSQRGQSIYNGEINSTIGSNAIINGSDGNDFLANYGFNVTINGGMGDDIIRNAASGINVSIEGGDGNDDIKNDGRFATIIGSAGNDSITNWSGADSVSINGGDGDDFIINGDVYTSGGFSVSINGDAGNDTLISFANNSLIDGGVGNDSILNGRANSILIGGADDDSISNYGENVTINGGEGNDQISLSSNAKENVIEYRRGEGYDTIWGYEEDDLIRIFDNPGISEWASVRSGNDVKIKVGGENRITVKDGFGKKIHTVVGESGTAGGLKGDGNNSSPGNDGGTKGGNHDNGSNPSEGTSSEANNNQNAVAGATSSRGSDGNGNSDDRGGNDIVRQNPSPTQTQPQNPELHSYRDNAAALEVETQAPPPEKLSLSFPTNWNFPSPDKIKLPSLILDGTPGNDELQAGVEGYQLWGHEGDDTLIGGDGYDVFFGGKNQGSDTFLNVSASDVVYLSDVTFNDLSRINKDGDTVNIAFKNGNSVTIQSTDTVSGAVVLSDLTVHFTHPPKS